MLKSKQLCNCEKCQIEFLYLGEKIIVTHLLSLSMYVCMLKKNDYSSSFFAREKKELKRRNCYVKIIIIIL